jgi:hypothetical protein
VTQRIEIDGFRIYVLHILAELDSQAADDVDAVIYGHSHQPKIETKNGTLFFNPGSAEPRRFRLPITVGRMTAEHGKLRAPKSLSSASSVDIRLHSCPVKLAQRTRCGVAPVQAAGLPNYRDAHHLRWGRA